MIGEVNYMAAQWLPTIDAIRVRQREGIFDMAKKAKAKKAKKAKKAVPASFAANKFKKKGK